MLGKGLESLIPKKDGDSGAAGSGFQDPQHYPAAAPEPQNLPQEEHKTVHLKPFTLHDEVSAPTTPPAEPIPDYQPITRPAEPVRPVPRPVKRDFDPNAIPPSVKKDEAVFQIETDKIRPNPHQPRHEFDEVALRELASSIREFGVIQPLVVSKIVTESEQGSFVEYELIAGERRLMASKLAGLKMVPVVIRRSPTEREKLEVAIIENIQRRDLNPIEQAKAFTRLQDEFRLTQREIAARLGKSREAVANSVRLLNLPLEIQTAVSEGRLSESQARLLLSIENIGEQKRFFDEILRDNLSVREIRNRLIKSKPNEGDAARSSADPETEAMKERLEEFLGTKVDLKDEGSAGRITINFYSKEELRGILQKMFRDGI